MAVSKEQKYLYNEKVRVYKSQAEDLKKEIATVKGAGRRNQKLDPYLQVRAGVLGIQRANTLVQMSRLSQQIQNIKNDTFLNDARKELSSRMTDLLKVVGDDLDGTLTDNLERLEGLSEMTPAQKLHLMVGFKEAVENVRHAMGETSKWRWNFPDMYLKLVKLTRNLLDFKRYERTKDPNDENYRPLQEYMRFMMEESQKAAQEYRSKYELSTNEVTDLQVIEKIFEMQKKVYLFTGQKDELRKATIALDNNKEKIEAQMAEKKGGKKKKS
ncbi:MAG: hypothetical protein RIF32_04030 [Leptospirales bacterium]|jgi:hypothetical protein